MREASNLHLDITIYKYLPILLWIVLIVLLNFLMVSSELPFPFRSSMSLSSPTFYRCLVISSSCPCSCSSFRLLYSSYSSASSCRVSLVSCNSILLDSTGLVSSNLTSLAIIIFLLPKSQNLYPVGKYPTNTSSCSFRPFEFF